MTLTKYFFIVLSFTLSSTYYKAAAQQDNNKYIINVPEQLSEAEQADWKKKLPSDGWIILRFKEQGDRLLNLSNQDYVLHLWLNCAGNSKEPAGYLVEYSDAYGDGDYGGIDFISSRSEDGHEAHFLLDGKDYKNPFEKTSNTQFREFTEALKKAKQLTLSVYDSELNPETGKDEQRLNRSINFKLAHSQLVDTPVNCDR